MLEIKRKYTFFDNGSPSIHYHFPLSLAPSTEKQETTGDYQRAQLFAQPVLRHESHIYATKSIPSSLHWPFLRRTLRHYHHHDHNHHNHNHLKKRNKI